MVNMNNPNLPPKVPTPTPILALPDESLSDPEASAEMKGEIYLRSKATILGAAMYVVCSQGMSSPSRAALVLLNRSAPSARDELVQLVYLRPFSGL